jgi:DNA (cytosine-5)-methyltransferase 1
VKHISLFSGIGGFDLAAQWAGWDNLASCEINPFGRKVLEYYWPNAYHHDDIKTLTGSIIEYEAQKRYGPGWRADGVILSGGFPCQDVSRAKQYGEAQQGLHGERTGLFFEMLRVISEVRPVYIVAENVSDITRINGGRDFSIIMYELSRLGYNAEWRICRASEVGACHQRARAYMVAYPAGVELEDAESFFSGFYETIPPERRIVTGTTAQVWDNWPNQPVISIVGNEFSEQLDGITFSAWLKESIQAAGNAVVPQLVFKIFQAINIFTHGTQSKQTNTRARARE